MNASTVISRALGAKASVRITDNRINIRFNDGLSTFNYSSKGLASSIRALAKNRRWVRMRNALIDALEICGVSLEKRCAMANKIMEAVIGRVPHLPEDSSKK